MPTQLPRHPFVPFRQIIEKIADKYIGSAFERKLFLLLSKSWYALTGIGQAEERIKDAFARGENGYTSKYKRFNSIYYPEFSASCIMDNKTEADPVKKASQLIFGALKFRESVLTNQLEPDHEGGKPLDMQRYGYIFSRLAISSLSHGKMLHEIIDVPPSEHIIIAIDGLYYKLQVLRAERIIPISEILDQVTKIVADARVQLNSLESDRFPFGLFTVIQSKENVLLFAKLSEKCPQTIQQLNNALFFVAIDIHDHPQTLEKLGRIIHWQNFHSRDYRRSLQLVITGNGHAGITGDPNAGIGGGFSGRFLDELAKECQILDKEVITTTPPKEGKLFQRLSFNNEMLAQHQDQLTALDKKVQSQFYAEGYNTIFRLDGIGKADFSRFGVSIDGVFHAALHLAFKRCFGKTPNIGNFIGLRSIQHGEIFRYNATTPEMKRFVTTPTAENLLAALGAHKVLIKQLKRGDDEIYQCEMLLVTLFNKYEISPLSCLLFIGLLGVFIENFNRRLMNPDMWVSHIPVFPGVAVTGRPGVKLSFLENPSMAGHYTLYDHHTMICFVTNPGRVSYYGQEARFAAVLRDALCELRQMLESQGGQPSSTAK